MLELGSEIAPEIVFDDEDAEEVGIAACAVDVPGKRGQTEAGDGDRVKAAECVAPALGEDSPQQYCPAGKYDGRGTFGENGETKEEAKEK